MSNKIVLEQNEIRRIHFSAGKQGQGFTQEENGTVQYILQSPFVKRLLLFGSQVSPKYKALYRYTPPHI